MILIGGSGVGSVVSQIRGRTADARWADALRMFKSKNIDMLIAIMCTLLALMLCRCFSVNVALSVRPRDR
jgi:hypothetical protein